MGKPERKRPLRRPRRRWGDNIKTDLSEVGCGPENGQTLLKIGPMASLCKGGNEPSGSLKAD